MKNPLVGLFHVRGGISACTCSVVAVALAVAFPQMGIAVRNIVDNPARGVGTPEIIAVLLASVLPALTFPRFDARELRTDLKPRLVHLGYTTVVLAAPLAIIPAWYWTVQIRFPYQVLPPMSGLIGNIATISCLATVLCLVLGGLASVLLTPVLFATFVVLQQARPGSILATEFTTGEHWHTNYWITAIAVLLTLALSWRLRAVPRTAR